MSNEKSNANFENYGGKMGPVSSFCHLCRWMSDAFRGWLALRRGEGVCKSASNLVSGTVLFCRQFGVTPAALDIKVTVTEGNEEFEQADFGLVFVAREAKNEE